MTQVDPNTGQELDWMLLDLIKGVEYRDGAGNRGLLKKWGDDIWSFWKHPDGQWVSACKATQSHIRVAARYNSPRRRLVSQSLIPTKQYHDRGDNDVHHPYTAYNQGYDAALIGFSLDSNPYKPFESYGGGGNCRAWWTEGWRDAQGEAER